MNNLEWEIIETDKDNQMETTVLSSQELWELDIAKMRYEYVAKQHDIISARFRELIGK